MTINSDTITLSANESVLSSELALEVNPSMPTDITGKTIDCSAAGCTFIFDGTKLNGCTIVGNNTTLVFQTICHTFDKNNGTPCSFQGKFYCDHLYPELFGAIGRGDEYDDTNTNLNLDDFDDTEALQACFDAAVESGIFRVRLQPRTYIITDTLYYRANLLIEGSHFWNYYHQTYGSRILAYFANTIDTHAAGEGKTAKYPRELKFALDSDCYQAGINEQNQYYSLGTRFPATKVFSSSSVLYFSQTGDYSQNLNDNSQDFSYTYAGPLHIKNVYIESKIDMSEDNNNPYFAFGAIRCIGMGNAHFEGIVIKGFMVGLMLSKGWAFKVERCQIFVGKWGMILGSEITDGQFDSVQIAYKVAFDILTADSNYALDALSSNCQNPTNPKNPYREFFDQFVTTIPGFGAIFGRTEIGPNNKPVYFSEKIYSAAIVARSTSATLVSCTMEGFDIGCVSNRGRLTFETPYVEYIKSILAYARYGCYIFNNMVGSQGQTDEFTYVAPYDDAKIILNHCHPGTFYPSYSASVANPEAQNKTYYNFKSYVVNNHDKRYAPLPYSATSYLDYDVSDTVFVKQYDLGQFTDLLDENNNIIKTKEQQLEEAQAALVSNWGDYYQHPIPFDEALNRIANDFNYRHVKKIMLLSDIEVNEGLTWQSQTGRITLQRSSSNYSLIVNAKQFFECDIVFKNLAIDLYSSLCFALNKQAQEIRIENTQIGFHRNDIYIIENNGTLPTGKTVSRSITLYVGTLPNVGLYYVNAWTSLSNIVVERSGTSLGAGSYSSLPTQYLYDGYDFYEVNVDPVTDETYTILYGWDATNNHWGEINNHNTPINL